MELKIHIEGTQELLSMHVSPEDAAKAERDPAFLRALVNDERERRSLLLIQEESEVPPECPVIEEATTDDGSGNKSSCIWSSECVHLLLTLYEEHGDAFSGGAKRHLKVWAKIAALMKSHNDKYVLTGGQCQSKLSGLKRTFKKIIDHNSVSGNDRQTWAHFDRMQEIFGKTGWVQPRAVASEAGPSAPPESPHNDSSEEKTPERRRVESLLESYVSEMKEERVIVKEKREKARQAKESAKERKFKEVMELKEKQHQDKMKMLQQLCQAISNNK